MRFIACGASVIGPRHVDLHEPNQDAMTLAGWRGGWIAAVADGLGSRAHSDIGSRCACQVARRILRAAPSTIDPATLPLIHQQRGVLWAMGLMLSVALTLIIVFWRKRYLARTAR